MQHLLSLFFLLVYFTNLSAQCNGHELLCAKKYNEVAYLTTHNAFNTEEDNFLAPNQTHSISQQLTNGVRALMLDVYDINGVATVYHSLDILGTAPLASILAEIKTFIDEHPNEILTIIFECYINVDAIATEMEQSGLFPLLFTKESDTQWPTLQEMIDSGKRLVIFSDCNDATPEQSWYHYVWDHAVETHFANHSTQDFSCNFNRGDSINDLFIINHFITDDFTGLAEYDSTQIANANPYLTNRIQQCQEDRNKFPNFIAVDFYELGNCFEMLHEVNGIPLGTAVHKNQKDDPAIMVWPNPASVNLNISISNSFTLPFDARLINIMGTTIYNLKKIKKSQFSISNSRLLSGTYFFLIEDAIGRTSREIIFFQ